MPACTPSSLATSAIGLPVSSTIRTAPSLKSESNFRLCSAMRLLLIVDHSTIRGDDHGDFTDAQAVAAVSRITRGNFRLLHRLFTQIERILKINSLSVITNDVRERSLPDDVSRLAGLHGEA